MTFIPSGLYFELYKWAHENQISYKELLWSIVRDELEQRKGWKCEHRKEDKKWSRKARIWYCRECYTLFYRDGKGGFIEKKPIWENKPTMTPEEWSRQIVPQNRDLK